MSTRIIFNDVAYDSVEHMPPDVRFAYEQAMLRFEDSDRDGIPDAVQDPGVSEIKVRTETRYVINGREYRSLDEMPPDVRNLIARERTGEMPAQLGTRVTPALRPPRRLSCTWAILTGAVLFGLAAALRAMFV